jgi:hypothetical protein
VTSKFLIGSTVYYERHFLYFGMIEFGMIDYW